MSYYLPPVVDMSCVGSHSGTVVQLTPHTARCSIFIQPPEYQHTYTSKGSQHPTACVD